MKHLNKTSSRILQFICQDLKEYKKIDNSNGNFMPLMVEVIANTWMKNIKEQQNLKIKLKSHDKKY